MFSSNKRWWRLRAYSFLGTCTRESRVALLPKGRLRHTPSSFADLVFTGERIEVVLRRGKFDYPTLMNWKPRGIGENKKEGGTHVVTVIPTWLNFPPAQQYQYSANISPSHYPPPYQPRTPNHL